MLSIESPRRKAAAQRGGGCAAPTRAPTRPAALSTFIADVRGPGGLHIRVIYAQVEIVHDALGDGHWHVFDINSRGNDFGLHLLDREERVVNATAVAGLSAKLTASFRREMLNVQPPSECERRQEWLMARAYSWTFNFIRREYYPNGYPVRL